MRMKAAVDARICVASDNVGGGMSGYYAPADSVMRRSRGEGAKPIRACLPFCDPASL